MQDLVDRARREERERCIGVIRNEMLRWERMGGVGVGWTWQKWRDQMLALLNRV